MKQHITEEQLNELSKKGKEKLRKWAFKKSGVKKGQRIIDLSTYFDTWNGIENLPYLSIGQMIEFLDENGLTAFTKSSEWHGKGWNVLYCIEPAKELSEKEFEKVMKKVTKKELCDALWEACKEVLCKK